MDRVWREHERERIHWFPCQCLSMAGKGTLGGCHAQVDWLTAVSLILRRIPAPFQRIVRD